MKRRIRINGEPHEVEAPAHVADVLRRWTARTQGIAVAVNGEVVPRGSWNEREVQDGDEIEIVQAVQGG